MTIEAQNALLKTLEEPPGTAYIIMTTSRLGALLPTVVSRCQRVPFGAVATSSIAAWVAERLEVPLTTLGSRRSCRVDRLGGRSISTWRTSRRCGRASLRLIARSIHAPQTRRALRSIGRKRSVVIARHDGVARYVWRLAPRSDRRGIRRGSSARERGPRRRSSRTRDVTWAEAILARAKTVREAQRQRAAVQLQRR